MTRLLLLLSSLLASPALAADPALAKCRQIDDIEERVTCYDRVVDARLTRESGEPATASKPPVTADEKKIPDAQSLFGTKDAEARQIVETTLAIEQIEQIEATISDVRESVGEKLLVTLDNGQVWRQLDSKLLQLKSGEVVVIRKASLGSFLLEKKSGSRSIRVKRIS